MTVFKDGKPHIEYVDLTDEERFRRLLEARAGRPDGGPMWVFAFGSLMWNPCFEYDVKAPGILNGYDRKFHIWTTRARGTPENPGLGLCLEDCGGACKGIAYRLVEDDVEPAWERLWEREMGSGIYRAAWVSVETETHENVVALTFIVDKKHSHYAGPLPPEIQASVMAHACGNYGPCRDYLAGTVEEMRKLDVIDPELEALLNAVDQHEGRLDAD